MQDGALTAVAGAFALSLMSPLQRSLKRDALYICYRVLSSPGCRAICMATAGCGGRCIGNNWKMATGDGKCCYHICDKCFARLIG